MIISWLCYFGENRFCEVFLLLANCTCYRSIVPTTDTFATFSPQIACVANLLHILIGERAKRVRHPLLLPIEKNVYIVRTSKPQCACSQFYVKRRSGRACIYEKPACCSQVQYEKLTLRTSKRQGACTSNNFTFARPLMGTIFLVIVYLIVPNTFTLIGLCEINP